MTGRIYMLNNDSGLMALDEMPYDSEKLLQELLAKHGDLLAGEQIDSDEPRRWLLVTREMSVQGEFSNAARWSLDHLFLDQDAIPTLIEVKKGTNTDIRRKVVGQMLDYAANAVVYWPVEEVRAKFENRCVRNEEDPAEVLESFLGEDGDADEFWQHVKTNLQAGRIRMIFVADSIPVELKRVVEFLNQQMDPAEVLAIEIKQFVGEGVKTLVPRVFGQSEQARQRKSPGPFPSTKWDHDKFMLALEANSGIEASHAAQAILEWVSPLVTKVWWGNGSTEGGVIPIIVKGKTKYHVCRFATGGWVAFRFDSLYKKPAFRKESVRRVLLDKINEIPGVHFGDEVLTKRARVPFDKLNSSEAIEKTKSALAWIIQQIRESDAADETAE